MAYVIPTIFSAVDKYSKNVVGMINATNSFGGSLNNLSMRSQRAFDKLPTIFGKATKSLIAYGEAALTIEGAFTVGKGILDYQTEIQDLSAVTGASGKQLDVFKGKIQDVANETRKSMVDVAKAFTAVDNNMPELHTDAAGLANVTKQSIILAQAARMELGPAAESLTMTLNQFGLKANKAADVIDALSAGAVAGSSRIAETTAALQKFGAASNNVIDATVNESIALVELGSKFEKGEEAGTRMRNILLDMANIKFGPGKDLMGPLGVNMELISNRSLPLIERLRELSKIKGNPEAMEKVFDKRNVVMASGLFSRMDDFERILKATYKKGGTMDMAAKENDTFVVSLQRMRDKFINIAITSDNVNGSLSLINGTIKFITNHMEGLISLAEPFILFVGAWWTFNKVLKVVTGTYYLWSAAIGVNTFLQNASLIALGTNTGALAGYTVAANAATVATTYFNGSLVAMAATVTVVTGGLALILAYHKEIAAWANNSTAGLKYNYAIGDYQKVKESLISNYRDDPAGTRDFIKDHPQFNSPALQEAFAQEDKDAGMKAIADQDAKDAQGNTMLRIYEDQHGGKDPKPEGTEVNVYLTMDRDGNVSVKSKGTAGAIPVNVHKTGG